MKKSPKSGGAREKSQSMKPDKKTAEELAALFESEKEKFDDNARVLPPDELDELQRQLLAAQRAGSMDEVKRINQKLRNSTPLSYIVRRERRKQQTQSRAAAVTKVRSRRLPRLAFFSIQQLQDTFREYSAEELSSALFLLDVDRETVMPRDPAKRFVDADRSERGELLYCRVDPALISVIEEKDKRGEVFWSP